MQSADRERYRRGTPGAHHPGKLPGHEPGRKFASPSTMTTASQPTHDGSLDLSTEYSAVFLTGFEIGKIEEDPVLSLSDFWGVGQ